MSTLPPRLAAPDLSDHLHDIQAVLGSGFAPLRHCTFWLLRVECCDRATAWLDRILTERRVKAVSDLRASWDVAQKSVEHDEIVTLAFSFHGLTALGLVPCEEFPFPSTFVAGMAQTSATADTAAASWRADNWRWGDTRERGAHLLVAHYRKEAGNASGPISPGELERSGFSVVARVEAVSDYVQAVMHNGQPILTTTEAFGFRDGIAQPVIAGLRRSEAETAARRAAGERFEDRVVAAGEFILGYQNEYGELSYCPNVKDWPGTKPVGPYSRFAMNGSYLAVQQIVQDASRLREDEQRFPSPPGAPSLAERMLGRRRDGRPLVQCPVAPSEPDAFRYRVDDYDGLQCPRGAHIRRANPRDMLGWDVESGIAASKLHRLLRRGRSYEATAEFREGLFFMALNADFERQFEFVEQRWIDNRRFGDLEGEDDLTSDRPPPHAFTSQELPTGRRFEDLGQYVDSIGGGYFFVPGLAALRFIAARGSSGPVR